ncbi:MAG: phosphopantothenoylcysteine decarboxylase [Sedimentisphaerales bacterium]|nr:phosphopantothenoylcysteine decarboxylase [Sedimentisphaerales bacterium]
MLENVNILLGVSGGVAAYKAVDLASKLTAAKARVRTVMTDNACQFVAPKSFEAVTGAPVFTTLWSASEEFQSAHISLADWAQIVVVAPATANIIGKVATGICDDLLGTTLCVCWQKPMLFAPAMNNRMWENPTVQRNVETLKRAGVQMTGPNMGRLACRTEAVGRMAEPTEIIEAIEAIAAKS